ncbi:MAG: flagellar basal body P-ring formation protein FlgA [Planctomycetes bacterium]|nr:flagellar basal body P-ring formation protein FlgA [Planctomycetota bacterium]
MIRALFILYGVLLGSICCASAESIRAVAPESEVDSVRLLSAARVMPGRITLGMVASVDGPQKEELLKVVLAESISQVPGPRFTLDSVMELVHAAGAARRGTLNAGRVAFHGSACTLTVASEVEPPASPIVEAALPPVPESPNQGSIQSVVIERLPGLLGINAAQTRLTFDEADRRVLATNAHEAKIDIKVLAIADRVPVQVTVYRKQPDGEYLLGNSMTIRIGVEVERTVVATIAPLRRGDVLEPAMFTARTEWLALTKQPLDVADATGSAVKLSKIAGGATLLKGDVEPAIAVRKGQVVTVHCISGQFVVKMQARALETGKVGQVIKFAPLDVRDRKDTRSFLARVETSGRAMMTVGDAAADSGSEP